MALASVAFRSICVSICFFAVVADAFSSLDHPSYIRTSPHNSIPAKKNTGKDPPYFITCMISCITMFGVGVVSKCVDHQITRQCPVWPSTKTWVHWHRGPDKPGIGLDKATWDEPTGNQWIDR